MSRPRRCHCACEGTATDPAGSDYTGVDCRSWMEEAGCQNVQVLPLQGSYSAAIGRK
jgi:hypothetical protein